MDEELKNKLNQLSLDLIREIQEGAAWASEQTSLFVQELVKFHIIEYSIAAFFCAVLLVIFSILSIKFGQAERKHETGGFAIVCFLSGVAAFSCFFGFCTSGTEVLKGIYAPRVLVIEKLRVNIK